MAYLVSLIIAAFILLAASILVALFWMVVAVFVIYRYVALLEKVKRIGRRFEGAIIWESSPLSSDAKITKRRSKSE